MTPHRLALLRFKLTKLWLISPERLWLLSIALQRRGHWLLAFSVKQLGTLLYHNSLSPEASVEPDVVLGHYGHGIVVNSNVTIGRRVVIWQNVTLTAGRPPRRGPGMRDGVDLEKGADARVIVGDGVQIGANTVVIAPRGRALRIARGARIGPGTVITEDVPIGARVFAPPPRVVLRESPPADVAAPPAPGLRASGETFSTAEQKLSDAEQRGRG